MSAARNPWFPIALASIVAGLALALMGAGCDGPPDLSPDPVPSRSWELDTPPTPAHTSATRGSR